MNGNAKIESTMLGIEDHGILTIYIYLKQDVCGQAFGGFALDGPYDKILKKRLPSVELGRWVDGILKAVGVGKWEDLEGEYVRVEGSDSEITGIGHIVEDKWFYPKQDLAQKL